MLFNSLAFFVFLAVVYAVYRLLPHRAQNRWLLAASFFFYGAWDWRFLGLILTSTVIDYGVGLALARSSDPRRRKWLVTTSIVANLALLGTFKYAGFFTQSLADLVGLFGFELSAFTRTVVLPVGISFYTFQTLSYTIDVYRGRLAPTRNFLDFALFVAFFPQLVAGPIERAVNLLQAHRRVLQSADQPAGVLRVSSRRAQGRYLVLPRDKFRERMERNDHQVKPLTKLQLAHVPLVHFS